MDQQMSSQERNHNRKDFISDLPSNILGKILEFMPIEDAARTSILSTNWRYKWTSLPKLVFDIKFCLMKKKVPVVTIINEILLLHDGPVRTFSLCIPLSFSNDQLGRWMLFLSRVGIREISLSRIPYIKYESLKLPSSFFSCQELTYLDLNMFIFEPPRVFRGFKHLTTLNFREVVIAADVFETLVSAAPLLKQLTCISCPGVDHVKFHSPNLIFVILIGEFKSICISKSPHLSVASICLFRPENYIKERSISSNNMIDHWPRLKKLVIGAHALKVFAAVDLQISFPHLVHLHLMLTYFQDVNQFSSAFCLIKRSPNLQELEILNPSFDSAAIQPIVNFINEKDYIECSLDRLKTIRMGIVNGSVLELKLLEYFLSSTPVLETMIVEISMNIDPQVEVNLTRKLMQFRSVSPNAEVIYKDNRKKT